MNERLANMNTVIAGIAWSGTILLYLIAGALMLGGHWQAAILVAEVSCGLSAYAAVRHLRIYAAKICAKIDDRQLDADIRRLSGVPGQRTQ